MKNRKKVMIKTLKKHSVFFFNNRKHTVLFKRNKIEGRQEFIVKAIDSKHNTQDFYFDECIVEIEELKGGK